MPAERAARHADAAFLGMVLAGLLALALLGPLERRIELVHDNDFSGFWAGARALVIGRDPYDAATWRESTRLMGTQEPDTAVYGYPPWVAIALVPLALLPLEAAAWVWMLATLLAAIVALRALLRALLPGRPLAHLAAAAGLLLSQPAYHAIVLGQWAPLLLAATAGAVLLLRRGRGRAAGFAALAYLAKPQLSLGVAAGLAVAAARAPAARRAVAVGACGVAAAAALGTLAFPGWWPAWSASVAPIRLAHPASLGAALTDVVGAPGEAVALVLTAAGAIVALRFRPGSDASLAVWLALSIAGAVYLWSYDQLLLLVPLVLAGGAVAKRDVRLGERLVAAGVLVLVVVSPLLYGLAVARHRETFSAIVPVVFFVAIAGACWPSRRDE